MAQHLATLRPCSSFAGCDKRKSSKTNVTKFDDTNGCGSWLLAVSPFLSIGGFALVKLQNSPGFFSQACQSSLESNVAVMHLLVFVSPLPFSVLATMTEPRQLMLLFDFSVESSGLSFKKEEKFQ